MRLRLEKTSDGKALVAMTLSDKGRIVGIYTLRSGEPWKHTIPGLVEEREIKESSLPEAVRLAGEGWLAERERADAG
jgi:hypothetical protein